MNLARSSEDERLDDPTSKPRLLFFRWVRPGLPDFLLAHLDEQINCLRLFFDVTLIGHDCDYDEVCDRYRPDLVIFESGVYAGKRSVVNTSSHPGIPKLGFLHADAFDSSRATFVSDMANWGVESFFTTSVSMADYTPEIADRLFVWPNFVNADIFRDYGGQKSIPVLFTGSQARIYPWRNSVSRVVSQYYPTMTAPHFGWSGESGSNRIVNGERYARTLNAAYFVPACGTITNDLVRKHLEIPAAGSCLVTERTPTLERFGFRDMENCVYADADDVVEKLDHLFRHPDEIRAITAAGNKLVRDRHTTEHRDEILQWLRLQQKGAAGQRIVQGSAFGPLALQTPVSGSDRGGFSSGGRDRQLLADGWKAMSESRFEDAERCFRRCMNYFFIPEAVIGLIYCRLHAGDHAGAQAWVDRTLEMTLDYQYAMQPDPIQWACRLRTLMCSGDLAAAVRDSHRYAEIRHPELDRVRRAVAFVSGSAAPTDTMGAPRVTITPVPERSDDAWRGEFIAMLRACGQANMASQVAKMGSTSRRADLGTASALPDESVERRVSASTGYKEQSAAERLREDTGRLVSAGVRRARSLARPVKMRLTTNDWSRQIERIAGHEQLAVALIVGPSRFSRGERGLRNGLSLNTGLPEIAIIGEPSALIRPGWRPTTTLSFVSEAALRDLLAVHGQDRAGIVLATRRGLSMLADVKVLLEADLVVLEGVNDRNGARVYGELMDTGEFEMLIDLRERDVGYVALRRQIVTNDRAGGGRIS